MIKILEKFKKKTKAHYSIDSFKQNARSLTDVLTEHENDAVFLSHFYDKINLSEPRIIDERFSHRCTMEYLFTNVLSALNIDKEKTQIALQIVVKLIIDKNKVLPHELLYTLNEWRKRFLHNKSEHDILINTMQYVAKNKCFIDENKLQSYVFMRTVGDKLLQSEDYQKELQKTKKITSEILEIQTPFLLYDKLDNHLNKSNPQKKLRKI